MKNEEPIKARLPGEEPDAMFPALTAVQQARVAAHGLIRQVDAGETVLQPNTQVPAIYIVQSGRLDVLNGLDDKEETVAICGPGMFTGELTVLSGRPGLVRIRAAVSSELIEIRREQLTTLLQTDSELSDIFLRAFILRRLLLIEQGV